MYASEKYVRMEVKELRTLINDVVIDFTSEIKQLQQNINEIRETLKIIQATIEVLDKDA